MLSEKYCKLLNNSIFILVFITDEKFTLFLNKLKVNYYFQEKARDVHYWVLDTLLTQ